MSVADFEKMWGNVGYGFNNYFIGYGAAGSDLPPGRNDGVQAVLGTLDGVTNITNGLDRIFSPDSFGSFVHGIPEFAGGLVQTIGCGVGAGLQLGAGWLNNAVDGVPVLQNVVQPFGDLVNGVGAALGSAFNGLGEACDDVGSAFEDLFSGDFCGFASNLGEGVADAAGGVVDAIGDGLSSVGDAISDFCSGW
jgi:hypothetical protein